MREITTTHLRQNSGAVITAVTAGETVRLVRGGHTVAYLVSPRDWNRINAITVAELAQALHTRQADIVQCVSTLVGDPAWGRARVIVDAEALVSPDVLLTPDACDEITRRIAAARTAAKEATA